MLLPTPRADLMLDWQADRDTFVITLWHDDVCVGSAPLTPAEGGEIASFVVKNLGERALWGPRLVVTQPRARRRLNAPSWAASGIDWLRACLRVFKGPSKH